VTLIDYLVHQLLPVILVFIGAACLYLVAAHISWRNK